MGRAASGSEHAVNLGTRLLVALDVSAKPTSSTVAALLERAQQHPAREDKLADRCSRIIQNMPSKPHDMRWDD